MQPLKKKRGRRAERKREGEREREKKRRMEEGGKERRREEGEGDVGPVKEKKKRRGGVRAEWERGGEGRVKTRTTRTT